MLKQPHSVVIFLEKSPILYYMYNSHNHKTRKTLKVMRCIHFFCIFTNNTSELAEIAYLLTSAVNILQIFSMYKNIECSTAQAEFLYFNCCNFFPSNTCLLRWQKSNNWYWVDITTYLSWCLACINI